MVDEAEAWRQRQAELESEPGTGGRWSAVEKHAFVHRQTCPRRLADGEIMEHEDVMEFLHCAYLQRGFEVIRCRSSLILEQRREDRQVEWNEALRQVDAMTSAWVRLTQASDDAWMITLDAQIYYLSPTRDLLIGAMGCGCAAIACCWPLLFLLPLALLGRPDRQHVIEALQAEVRGPLDTLATLQTGRQTTNEF